MAGMFFNPFGFDAIQLLLIKLTGSYGKANLVLYFLAACCFGLYFLFSGNNPILEIKDIIKTIYEGKVKHYYNKLSTNKRETPLTEEKFKKTLNKI
jgi:hypothetical protein